MAADVDVAVVVDHCAGNPPDKILLLEDNRMDVRLLQQLIRRRQPRRPCADDDSLRQKISSLNNTLQETHISCLQNDKFYSIIICEVH